MSRKNEISAASMRPSTDESSTSGSVAALMSAVKNEQMTVMMATAKMMMNRMLYEDSGSRRFFSVVRAMVPLQGGIRNGESIGGSPVQGTENTLLQLVF